MRLDAHQHFWRYNANEFTWISPEMVLLKKNYLPANLVPLLASVQFEGSIVVQAQQTLQETGWLLDLADHNPFIKGVVGWVDLRCPSLAKQLEEFCSHPKLCGVRHVVQDEPEDHFLLGKEFTRGLRLLTECDLAYDLLIFPRHLRVACQLVDRFPEQRFVLDHMAEPSIKSGQISSWKTNIRRLAAHPNIYCKISGMVTEADWHSWQPTDFYPYLDVVFESFGAGRLMIGSDWPVCTLAGTYWEVLKIVRDCIRQSSDQDQAAVLGENAHQFYKI